MTPASPRAVNDPDRASAHSAAHTRDAAGALLALAGETVVLLLGFSSDVAVPVTLALHAAIVAALGIFLFAGREQGSDVSMAATILLVVMVAGPAGAAVALAALPLYNREGAAPGAAPGAASGVLKEWYERLASAGRPEPATELYDRIMSGRVPRLDTPAPLNFSSVIEQGTLDERQKALGLIARHFHPDYTPVLEAALKSPEPVVRVQAAAVVAHVKANLKTRIKRLSCEGKDASGPRALMRLGEMQALQGCSLVDRPEQEICRATALGILERSLAAGADIASVAAVSDAGAGAAIERYLLNSARFRDLRVLRRVRSITQHPALRLRRSAARHAA